MEVARIDGNKWAVGARGFNERFGGKLLVQIDGRTQYTPIFSGVYWDSTDYPLEDIERTLNRNHSAEAARALDEFAGRVAKLGRDEPRRRQHSRHGPPRLDAPTVAMLTEETRSILLALGFTPGRR